MKFRVEGVAVFHYEFATTVDAEDADEAKEMARQYASEIDVEDITSDLELEKVVRLRLEGDEEDDV